MNKMSDQLGELFGALAKAQGKIRGALKDSKNPFFKSNYASLHECWAAIREPLSENGLSIIQTIEEENGKLYLRSILGHSSGQYISSLMPIILAKQDPQSMGSATTYARRYSLSALIGLSPMDDDGEEAMQEHRKPAEKETTGNGKAMGIEEFCEKTSVDDVQGMTGYLAKLEKDRNVSMQKIMEQALKPELTQRFLKGYKDWVFSQEENA